MKVLKFGGTSVGSSEAFKKVKNICIQEAESNKIVVVVSALSQITNKLQYIAELAASGNANYNTELLELENKHLDLIREIIPLKIQSRVIAELKTSINELEDIVKGIFLIRELTEKSTALVLSFGEKLSSKILYHYIKASQNEAKYWDSSELIIANGSYANAVVNKELTSAKISEKANDGFNLAVMPGFISSNSKGEITTLGRGGSDYTASLIASELKAKSLEIWTDVDGILTADPRLVKQAYSLDEISYDEAMELSHFGAKVLYPPSIQPALQAGISMVVKNTFKAELPGTKIVKQSPSKYDITGISAIRDISTIDIFGSGMVDTPGYASRVFKCLADAKINIVLITQASSEHSITLAVKENSRQKALEALQNEFALELHIGKIEELNSESNLAIIALVGENMKHKSGLSGRAFSAMGNNGINIRAIAQGSSEKNLSMIVSYSDMKKAVNVLHEEFFLSEYKKIHLYLAGIGNVGGALIEQIKRQKHFLRQKHRMEMVVVGIINSKKYLIDANGIDLDNWKKLLNESNKPANLEAFHKEAELLNKRNAVFVDNSAHEEVAAMYKSFLNSKISVACSNKIAAASAYENYLNLKSTAIENRVSYLYEANVGAGLPVIDTINNLVKSGDKITKIEGVLSGSLSFIFDNYKAEESFASIVKKAKAEGYTEPDPRIDLSGKDVARKILILARESNYQLESEDVVCKDFLPESCLGDMSVEDFLATLEKEEEYFKNMYYTSNNSGESLKIVASFEEGKAMVSLKSLKPSHAFSRLNGTDNMLLIYSERYPEHPMIIQGAGAGAEVTSAGVFGDIIRTLNR